MVIGYFLRVGLLALGSAGVLAFGLSLVPDLLRRANETKLMVLGLSVLGSVALALLALYARSRADLWDIVTDRRFIVREGGGRLVQIRYEEICRVTEHRRGEGGQIGALLGTRLDPRFGPSVFLVSGTRPGRHPVADFLENARTRPGYIASIPTCKYKP